MKQFKFLIYIIKLILINQITSRRNHERSHSGIQDYGDANSHNSEK